MFFSLSSISYDLNILPPFSHIHLHSWPLQGPYNKILILSFLHMPITISITQLHPHINILLGWVISIPAKRTISFIQQRWNLLLGDRIGSHIPIFLKQPTCNGQVILRRSRVFTLRFLHSFIPDLTLHMLLTDIDIRRSKFSSPLLLA